MSGKGFVSKGLAQFIRSGLIDYSYSESGKARTDLSLGTNPLGPSPKISRKGRTADIRGYLEVASGSLAKRISEAYGIPEECVIVGAGASDLLHLALVSFTDEGSAVVLPRTTFQPSS